MDLLLDLGMAKENVWLTDLAGVVYQGRQELMDPDKARFAQPTAARTLTEVHRRGPMCSWVSPRAAC